MKARQLAFVYSPETERCSYPADCPFKTERAGLTRSRLRSLGLLGTPDCAETPGRKATDQELLQFHSTAYLEILHRAAEGDLGVAGREMGLGGPDTPIFHDLFEYGAWACGAALTGAELLLGGEADVAFSLLGGFHHAMPERAAGFCYVNDPVLACMRAAAAGKRVLYLDADAHHGDGVQEAFYRRNDIFTISVHETGKTLFPLTGFEDELGAGAGLGFNVNVPLPPWTYDEAFLLAFRGVVLPLVHAYAPELIILELGMDTLAGDPLTHLQMTNNIVPEILESLLALERPLLVLGGGGYHVDNTVRGWALAWRTCADTAADDGVQLGLGGVMLESTEWAGGLRDRTLPVAEERRRYVESELSRTIFRLRQRVFPLHGLPISDAVEGFG